MEKIRRVERARIKLLHHLRTIGNFPVPEETESFQNRVHIEDFKAYNAMKQKQGNRTSKCRVVQTTKCTDGNVKQRTINKGTPKTLTKKPEHVNHKMLQVKRKMLVGKSPQAFHDNKDRKRETCSEDDDWGFDITMKNRANIVEAQSKQRPRKKARKQFVHMSC